MTERELLDCFTQQPDGSWLCIKPVVLGGAARSTALLPGVRVARTDIFMGHHLDTELREAEAHQHH